MFLGMTFTDILDLIVAVSFALVAAAWSYYAWNSRNRHASTAVTRNWGIGKQWTVTVTGLPPDQATRTLLRTVDLMEKRVDRATNQEQK